jgi:hypothetical protein
MRYGVFGCLGIAGIALVVVAAILTTAWLQMRSERVESRELTAAPSAAPSEAAPPDAPAVTASQPVRVVLEVAVAAVTIEAAPPGEPIRVLAEYDPRQFRLEHDYQGSDEAGWTYRVEFAPNGWRNLALLRVKLGAAPPELRLLLPRDVPLVLEGLIDRSHAAVELEGLHLRAVDLEVEGGALDVSVWEPLPVPMERLVLRGHTGMVKVARVGNASPGHVEIAQHMGAIDLDLRGAWLRDADVRIEGHVAGGSIRLPRNVTIEGLDVVPRGPGRDAEVPSPTLRLSLSSRVGDMVVIE